MVDRPLGGRLAHRLLLFWPRLRSVVMATASECWLWGRGFGVLALPRPRSIGIGVFVSQFCALNCLELPLYSRAD